MKRSYLSGLIFLIVLILMGTISARAYENEINSISATIGGKIATSGKKLVAVTDFVDLQGNVTELGRFLAEEFSTAIAGSGKGFEVVDRANLKIILAEHKLSTAGIIDPATARKLGQVAGVQALITGTITPFGDSVRLSVKVLDTETAKVISAANVNIAKTKAVEELLARGIDSAQVPSVQQPAAPGSSPPAALPPPSSSSANIKKIGPVVITVKRIAVDSKARLSVYLDIYSQLKEQSGFAIDRRMKTTMADEKGNTFYLSDGMPISDISGGWSSDGKLWPKLNPMSNNDFRLILQPEDSRVTSKDIGSIFSLSMTFGIMAQPGRRETTSLHSVSFSDIKSRASK